MLLRNNPQSIVKHGIYPMLYTLFEDNGELRHDPFLMQVDTILSTSASGVAILGLGTEVSKLTFQERVDLMLIFSKRLNGRKPLLVTVYGDTVAEQINFSKYSIECGASGLILQPPSQKMDEANLVNFFSEIIASVNCPVGIKNAPEFFGFGLSTQK